MSNFKLITTFSNFKVLEHLKAISYIKNEHHRTYYEAREIVDTYLPNLLNKSYDADEYYAQLNQKEKEEFHTINWMIKDLERKGYISFEVRREKVYPPKTVFEIKYEEWEAKQPAKFLEEHAKRSQVYVSAG